MSDKQLRRALIKLAHENPEIREDLLPLLKDGGRKNARAHTPVGEKLLTSLKAGEAFYEELVRATLALKKGGFSDQEREVRQLRKDLIKVREGVARIYNQLDPYDMYY